MMNSSSRPKLPSYIKERCWLKHAGNQFQIKCSRCQLRDINPYTCQYAHHVAHSRNGTISVDNMIPLCHNCNLEQYNFTPAEVELRTFVALGGDLAKINDKDMDHKEDSGSETEYEMESDDDDRTIVYESEENNKEVVVIPSNFEVADVSSCFLLWFSYARTNYKTVDKVEKIINATMQSALEIKFCRQKDLSKDGWFINRDSGYFVGLGYSLKDIYQVWLNKLSVLARCLHLKRVMDRDPSHNSNPTVQDEKNLLLWSTIIKNLKQLNDDRMGVQYLETDWKQWQARYDSYDSKAMRNMRVMFINMLDILLQVTSLPSNSTQKCNHQSGLHNSTNCSFCFREADASYQCPNCSIRYCSFCTNNHNTLSNLPHLTPLNRFANQPKRHVNPIFINNYSSEKRK